MHSGTEHKLGTHCSPFFNKNKLIPFFFILASDLDSIRALFNEKEKELSLAVAKVEELTRQLEDVRRGRAAAAAAAAAVAVSAGSAGHAGAVAAASLELDKLRRELMVRFYFIFHITI